MSFYRGEKPNPRCQFADVVRRVLTADSTAAERFWRHNFAGFRNANQFVMAQAPTEQAFALRSTQQRRTTIDTSAIKHAAAALGMTVASLVASAWALVIWGFSGERDIAFGMTVSGRSSGLPGDEESIGLLINTLPLRIYVSAKATRQNFLQAVHRALQQLYVHEATSLSDIQTWTGA